MRDRIGSTRVTAGKPANGHTGGPALTKSPCGSGVVDEREHKNKRKKTIRTAIGTTYRWQWGNLYQN
jgi:hypothetical protein